jgi:ribosome-binding factor A
MSRNRSSRMRKIDELLREVLAEEVPRLKDPRIGFVTITGVDTSPDLHHATVFYSVLGDEEEQAATAEGLRHAAPHLQAVVGQQVRIKYTPVLEFHVDPSVEQGLRISQILSDLRDEATESGRTHDDDEPTAGEEDQTRA